MDYYFIDSGELRQALLVIQKQPLETNLVRIRWAPPLRNDIAAQNLGHRLLSVIRATQASQDIDRSLC